MPLHYALLAYMQDVQRALFQSCAAPLELHHTFFELRYSLELLGTWQPGHIV